MKHYSCAKIKEYIEANKENINAVECGMSEDWFWTAEAIFEDGKYSHDLSGDTVRVAGITGSYWATPVMRIYTKDGRTELVDCYFEDSDTATPEEIGRMKEFASAFGGMDDVANA